MFVREIFGTRRKQVIRLIISEGPRFPAIAEFYYREVLAASSGPCGPGWCARWSAAKSPTTP